MIVSAKRLRLKYGGALPQKAIIGLWNVLASCSLNPKMLQFEADQVSLVLQNFKKKVFELHVSFTNQFFSRMISIFRKAMLIEWISFMQNLWDYCTSSEL